MQPKSGEYTPCMNYYCFVEFLPFLDQPAFLSEECVERLGKMSGLRPDAVLQFRYCLFCSCEVLRGFFVVENLLTRPLPPLLQNPDLGRPSVLLKSTSPRLCCPQCANEYAQRNRVSTPSGKLAAAQPLSKVFSDFMQNRNSTAYSASERNSHSSAEEAFFQMLNEQLQLDLPDSLEEPSLSETLPSFASAGKPFLVISHLVKMSPADQAGLRLGDAVVRFGPFTAENFEGLETLVRFVANTSEPIEVVVLRKTDQSGVLARKLLKVDLPEASSPSKGVLGVVLKRHGRPLNSQAQN